MMTENKALNIVELFKGKTVPPFLKNHPVLAKPLKVKKVFPFIGLENFKQETNITKCMVDIKKEGGYVWNMLAAISSECNKGRDLVSISAQKTQFLAPIEERLAKKDTLNEVAHVSSALTTLSEVCDPRSAYAFNASGTTSSVVTINAGKVEMRLNVNISSGDKILHKAGLPIFRLYKSLRDKCIEHGVKEENMLPLESMEAYKIFSKENIPNKKYKIVFSSNGTEGAWDLMTMSMRGIRSCQRWDGEYPKCLIGSVLSKFVGIIYLTSGVDSEPYGDYGILGSKMMRRSVIRYAYDNSINSPCLIVDKMYPAEDEEILKSFIEILSTKSKLPVYYGPHLQNKIKHIYIPNEEAEFVNIVSNREKSYQDTALRSKTEFDAHILSMQQSEINKNCTRMQNNIANYFALRFEDIYRNDFIVDPNVKKVIDNLLLSNTFSVITESLISSIFGGFIYPQVTNYYSVRSFNKDFLKQCFIQRKNMFVYGKQRIDQALRSNLSIDYDLDLFVNFMSSLLSEFVRKELLNIGK